MKAIFQLTAWLTARGGGIPPVIEALTREFLRRNLDCRVAGLADRSGEPCILAGQNVVSCGRVSGPAALGYSPDLRKRLLDQVTRDSVVHAHGLWMYPALLARQLAQRSGAAFVISPHGMLEPWALNHSRWKKKIAGWLFENRNLRSADCLHALCAAEAENFRCYGLRNPIAVIPNGIDPAAFERLPERGLLEARFPVLRDRRWGLFLSRIHPKKGLPHLLRAWKSVVDGSRNSRWMLVVVGLGEGGHAEEMKHLTAELGLERRVCFTGPLQGQEKLAALAGAELFVLPSFSEGFSMAVLEAAAAGLPALLTPQCNFPELARAGGAIEAVPNTASCEAALSRLLSMTDTERRAMGQRGKDLVCHAYAWPAIAQQMLAVYDWALHGGTPPACVRLN